MNKAHWKYARATLGSHDQGDKLKSPVDTLLCPVQYRILHNDLHQRYAHQFHNCHFLIFEMKWHHQNPLHPVDQ